MEFRNGELLQLIECIESTQNEVKRKMIDAEVRDDAPRSPARIAHAEKICMTSQLTLIFSYQRVVKGGPLGPSLHP